VRQTAATDAQSGTIGRVIRAVQGKFAHPEPEPIPRWRCEASHFEHAGKRSV